MPYKDKRKYAEAMRRYRQRQKQKIKILKKQFPDAFDFLFGKPTKRRKK